MATVQLSDPTVDFYAANPGLMPNQDFLNVNPYYTTYAAGGQGSGGGSGGIVGGGPTNPVSGQTPKTTPDIVKKSTSNDPCPCYEETIDTTYYLSRTQTPGSVPVRGQGTKVVCNTPPPTGKPKIKCDDLDTALQQLAGGSNANAKQTTTISGLKPAKFYHPEFL